MPSEKWREFMSKFAKKGVLLVDVTNAAKPAKLAVVGQENTAKGKKILKEAGIKEAPVAEDTPPKKGKAAKGAKIKAGKAPQVEKAADDKRSIKIIHKGNPYREGTKAAATFDLMAKAKTVTKFKEEAAEAPSDYDISYLRYAERDGFVKLG